MKPELLEVAPPLTDMFKSAKGGLRGLIKAMRFATEDSEIRAFLHKYDSIPVGDRPYIPWEAIAISANVNMTYLIGAVHLAAAQYFGNISKMIAISNHPTVTRMRVKYSQDPSGESDRRSLDIMVGALPSAKGPTFIGKAVFGPSGSKSEDDDDDDDDAQPVARTFGAGDEDAVFPPSSDMQAKLRLVRQNQIEAPKKG